MNPVRNNNSTSQTPISNGVKARISEIFESIQGEGLYLGEKQLFVRFFGCNLSCNFCDTKLKGFREYAPQELVDEIKQYPREHHSISFTGGEPLLHKDFLKETLKLSVKNGYKNYLETNGTLAGELKEVIDDLDIVAMDVKLPSSSGMGLLWGLHRKFLKVASKKEVFIKAVICESTLKEDLMEAIKLIREVDNSAVLVLQPNSFEESSRLEQKTEEFRELSVKEGVAACIIPQIHKKVGWR